MSDYLEGRNAAAPDPNRPEHMRGFYDAAHGRAQKAQQAKSAQIPPLTTAELDAVGAIPIAIFIIIVFVFTMIALAWTAVLCAPVVIGALMLRRGDRSYFRVLAATGGAASVLIIAVIALVSAGWPYGGPPKSIVAVALGGALFGAGYLIHRNVARRSGIVRCMAVAFFVAFASIVGTFVANQSSLSFRVAEEIVGTHKANVFAKLAEERTLYEWLDFGSLWDPEPMRRADYLDAIPSVEEIEAAVQGPSLVETAAYREVVVQELKHMVLSIAPGNTFHKELSGREQALIDSYLYAAQRFKEEKLRARKTDPNSPVIITGFLLGTKLAAVSVIREHWPALPRAYALHRRGRLN